MRNGMNNDDAVSEVIGVMLMISVTLIIVALVAVYATGSAGDTKQPIRADLVASDVTTVDKNGDTWYQVVFDHRSGDPFNIDQVQVSIGSRENFTVHMLLWNEPGKQQYIETFDPDNQMVLLGDRFKVSIGTYDHGGAKVTLPGDGGREIKCGEHHLTYRFIDRRTDSPISSGEVLIRRV
jgi:FlaG/FlaF family flagellin (archaellin)